MRVLQGRAINLSHTFYSDDEETPLTLTTVTATLYDYSGTQVATGSAVNDGSDNWTYTFAAQPLGVYSVKWDGDSGSYVETDYIEVVGNHLFSVRDARNSNTDLADATAFPGAEIIQYRESVETEFTRITGRSFTTRVGVWDFVSDGSDEHVFALIPDTQQLVALWLDYGDGNGFVAVDDLTGYSVNSLGKLTTPNLVDEGVIIRVQVKYGFQTPPADVARAGMIRLLDMMQQENSGMPDRAITWQPAEGGTFRLATAGSGQWRTGIPEVDATLKNYTLDAVMAVFGVG